WCSPLRPSHPRAPATMPASPLPFSRRRDPRALHSFPTRRSSDLQRDRFLLLAMDPFQSRLAQHEVEKIGTGGSLLSGPSRRPVQDRKSTRLNSSHVSISYAVFCLKNKRPAQAPMTAPPPPSTAKA